MIAQEADVPVESATPSGEIDHGMGRERLRRFERVAVQFEEEHTDHEADALVPVDEGMVANDGLRVECGQLDDVGSVSVSEVLWWASQSRREQAGVAEAVCTTIESKQPSVNRERIALLDPGGLLHSESARKVSRYREAMSSTCRILRSKSGSYGVS